MSHHPDGSFGAPEATFSRCRRAELRLRAIGDGSSLAEGTVKLHLHHIYEKLSVDGRLELILYAHKHKLL